MEEEVGAALRSHAHTPFLRPRRSAVRLLRHAVFVAPKATVALA